VSKRAFLFPGQGAQAVGMGRDFCDIYAIAAETFHEAEGLTGLPMRKICSEGPESELGRSDVCQPALLTLSIAILRVIRDVHPQDSECMGAAGLSLGEYSALVCADSIAFGDAVKLVQKRGRLMQQAAEARPGGMAAIVGLTDSDVEAICADAARDGTVCAPANYNAPEQLVITGDKATVEKAAAACKERGATMVTHLDVAGAYHCMLMKSAADAMREVLNDVEIRAPKFSIISNVTAAPHGEPADIRECLIRQVTSPVRWKHSMAWLINEGFTVFREIGPGRVLCGLLRRIDRSRPCASINSCDQLSKF